MTFHLKKGAADPFRGSWYIHENSFSNLDEAVAAAAKLTQQNLADMSNGWEQYGYEWSVFETTPSGENKIWEGFKAVMIMKEKSKASLELEDGWLA